MRPDEISVHTNEITSAKARQCPFEVACQNAPLKEKCYQGYVHFVEKNPKHLTANPNTFIKWCTSNIPTGLNTQERDSWLIGCYNGIKGPHKVLHDADLDKTCEQLRTKYK
jgi:hypothetical protein